MFDGETMTLNKPDYFIGLSILCHIVLFLLFYYFSYHPIVPPVVEKEKSYYYYVPAQVARESSQALTSSAKNNSIEKTYDLSQFKTSSYQDWSKTDAFNQLTQQSVSRSQQKYQEAIHLIGDEFLDDPLRKLLGKAITAHIYYPDVARELYMRGVVSIEFILHPDGTITKARVIQSSHERILDTAALRAITDSSPVNGVDLYVKQPRKLVINIIF